MLRHPGLFLYLVIGGVLKRLVIGDSLAIDAVAPGDVSFLSAVWDSPWTPMIRIPPSPRDQAVRIYAQMFACNCVDMRINAPFADEI